MKRSLVSILLCLIILPLIGAGCILVSTKKTSDGGIFRSDDLGETWVQKVFVRQEKKNVITINNVNIETIEFHPTDRNIIYLGTMENGVYRSTNSGDQWVNLGLMAGDYPTISIDPKSPTIIYTATGPNILKSSDDGKTWETIYLEPRNQKITSVNVDFFETSQIIASTETGTIIQSSDFGVTWSLQGNAGTNVKKLYLNPNDSRVIYAITKDQGIFKSTDKGATWNSLNNDLSKMNGAKTINGFFMLPSNPDQIFLATNYGLLKSENGGASWQTISTLFPFGTVSIKTVTVNPANTAEILFSIGKVIHKTTDGSTTWKTIENIPTNRTINVLVINPANPQVLYAGTYAPKKR